VDSDLRTTGVTNRGRGRGRPGGPRLIEDRDAGDGDRPGGVHTLCRGLRRGWVRLGVTVTQWPQASLRVTALSKCDGAP
jgi:hypothetical protein